MGSWKYIRILHMELKAYTNRLYRKQAALNHKAKVVTGDRLLVQTSIDEYPRLNVATIGLRL